MKTPEDEAFDDMARRQGMWGGGFQAKRQAAMDKVNAEFYEEYIKYRTAFPKGYIAPQQAYVPLVSVAEPAQDSKCKLCVDGCIACDARAQPAQEPVAWCIEYGGVLLYAEGSLNKKEVEDNFARNFNEGLSEIIPFYTTPPKREWVGLTDEDRKAVLLTAYKEWECEELLLCAREDYLLIEQALKEKNT
jgi:hypothetical protein